MNRLPEHIKELLRVTTTSEQGKSTAKYSAQLTNKLMGDLETCLFFAGLLEQAVGQVRTLQPQNLPRPKHRTMGN